MILTLADESLNTRIRYSQQGMGTIHSENKFCQAVRAVCTGLHCSAYQPGQCHQTSLNPKLKDKL